MERVDFDQEVNSFHFIVFAPKRRVCMEISTSAKVISTKVGVQLRFQEDGSPRQNLFFGANTIAST